MHAMHDGGQLFNAPFELPKNYVKQAKLTEKGTSRADVLTVVEESETAHP